MRVLIAIPHFFRAGGTPTGYVRRHASHGTDPRPRVAALTAAISALHQHHGSAQHILDIATKTVLLANATLTGSVDIIVCTTGGDHLLNGLSLPSGSFEHRVTQAEPMRLGFECHAALRERLGAYDYYGYLEDDLILRDPWFFAKLSWFNRQVGDTALLQPNRYEVGPLGPVHKIYIDGDMPEAATSAFQDRSRVTTLRAQVLDVPLVFHRPTNPHAGCFFLNSRQMAAWASRPDFLDRDTSFVGPLESAATLGIMRAFRVYKPAVQCASFLEIEHHGTAILSQLRRRSPSESGECSPPESLPE
jgi:hypothetical protein